MATGKKVSKRGRPAAVKAGAKGAAQAPKSTTPTSAAEWTFLTNHAHVLICLAGDHHALLRDVAQRVGITERAVQGIVADLEAGGVLSRTRDGRRNVYSIHPQRPLRHPVEAHRSVADLLALAGEGRDGAVAVGRTVKPAAGRSRRA